MKSQDQEQSKMIETMETIFDEYMKKEIDSITAIERLEQYCGMLPKEAEELVEAWDDKFE